MESEDYLVATTNLYRDAAQSPDPSLCCTGAAPGALPGLHVPPEMLAMNYGCGTTVFPGEVGPKDRVLYVGVGAGLEALQFAYYTQKPGGVIAVDVVEEMMERARTNLALAERSNPWLKESFVEIRTGDARQLPVEDGAVTVAAQNCLFNIFREGHLESALSEMHRVLAPGGRLFMSDPVATRPIPAHLAGDDRLRAACLSGALSLEDYLQAIVAAGFGTVEIRSKAPYRVLDPERYGLDAPLLLESVELCAVKVPVPADGPCVFTGRTAFYVGADAYFDDGKGHVLTRDLPASVCDKTAEALSALGRADLFVTPPTWAYRGGGCC